MRPIWKGHIRFSLVTIPIRIYSALERMSTVSFRQLHKEDNGRIKYDKRCSACNEKVAHQDIVKGYEYEPDQYVVMDDDDFANVKLESTNVIDIEAFIDRKEIHPTMFEKPYYAGPDGEVASQVYNLLRHALKESGKVAIGRVVLREVENVMLISPYKKGLMLYQLRYDEELRDINEVPKLQEDEIDDAQLEMAQTLIGSLTKKFSDLDFKDRYRESLMELIQDKIDGKEVVVVQDEKKTAPVIDIMSALKASIEKSNDKKSSKSGGKKTRKKASAKKKKTA